MPFPFLPRLKPARVLRLTGRGQRPLFTPLEEREMETLLDRVRAEHDAVKPAHKYGRVRRAHGLPEGFHEEEGPARERPPMGKREL